MLWKTFERIDKYYSKICKLPQKKFSPETLEKLPRDAGVYVIYYKNRPLYVGRSNNMRRRFLQQHLSPRNDVASSSFRMHLLGLKKIRRYKDVRGWILENCKIKFVKVDNYDDSILLEATLIRIWRKKYKLVNDYKYEL